MALSFNSPVAVDGYSRTWVELFDDRNVMAGSFAWQALFGRADVGGRTVFSPNAEVIDIDIIRGDERIAAYIHRGTNARSVNQITNTRTQKYTANSYRFPLAELEGTLGASQINKRVAGEEPYGNLTPQERLMRLGGETHYEHVRRMIRLFEVSAKQSILDGEQKGILGTTNSDLIYDWQRDNDNEITVSEAWDTASAEIMQDIDDACDKVRENGHVHPDMMVVGSDAMRAMLEDSDFKSLSDNRRIGMVAIDREADAVPPRFQPMVDGGMIWRGILYTAQGYRLYVFTYPDVYEDENGTQQEYMEKDEAVILSSRARFDRYFGPPEMLPLTAQRRQFYVEMFGIDPGTTLMPPNFEGANVIDPRMFYFDAYPSDNQKNVTLRTQAAPLFSTTHTDAVVVLDGLID